MEKLRGKEIQTFEVKCIRHGVLGYVYSAHNGMLLFDGHRQQMEEDCLGVEIMPKTPPLVPQTKPEQRFIPP